MSDLHWKGALEVRIDTQAASVLADTAQGTLPSVSWIDPDFSNPSSATAPMRAQ